MARIVIVEDQLDIASVVQDYLRAAGYETTHFADGQGALEHIVESPPDLTLLDIGLPRLDGIEVLRSAREHTDHPVIMVTARIEELDRLLGLELGADDYVCKPFSRASWSHAWAPCCGAFPPTMQGPEPGSTCQAWCSTACTGEPRSTEQRSI